MTRHAPLKRSIAAALLTGLAACQGMPRAATLDPATPQAVEALKQVLAKALGRGKIELGAGDPARDSTLAVLPPALTALEGNSPALPDLFDVLVTSEGCFVRRQTTGELFALSGIACRAVR